MEAFVARIDTSLATLLRRFDDLMTRERDRQQGHNNYNNNHLDEQVEDNNNYNNNHLDEQVEDNNNYNNNHLDEQVEDNWDEYSADSELDKHDDAHRLMAGVAIDDVRYATMMIFFINSSL
jgi:hypothetical protein